jgi:heterodisulfide reductase subunit A
VEAGRSPNLNIITHADLLSVDGEVGHFTARLRQRPRYVDARACTACGVCSQYCPVPIKDAYNQGLTTTKALHIDYQQAIPAAYHVEEDACLFLTRKECKQCERVCQARAIDFTQKAKDLELEVGAIILAPGFGRIDRRVLAKYGYDLSADVITGMELERLTSASGPTQGEIVRPSDGRHPERLAFLQCIGSRDTACGNGYCSTVCCMYAIKEALVCLDHTPELAITIFYMDMRTQGKEFDYARLRAQDRGIRFVRSRFGSIQRQNDRLAIAYVDDAGNHHRESFDLVVLPEGLESPRDAQALAQAAGIELNHYDFCRTHTFAPLATSRPGIYVAGAFQAPKDVPESVTDASGAAALVAQVLKAARGTQIRTKTYPLEIAPDPERPRLGVFICACGTNISGVVDVPAVAAYAATLEKVAFVDTNLYSCAQGTQELITEKIQVQGLNGVVVAACTPRTHEPLFQETLKNAGLNACLFEMANIRDHCSWVHSRDRAAATEKAKDLVRMAVAKAQWLTPLPEQRLPVIPRALVIGGGLAGMTAALNIAEQGFVTFLVEKTAQVGGNLRRLHSLLTGENPQKALADLEARVRSHPLIQVFTEAEIESISGYVGNFASTVRTAAGELTLEHGVVVVATGGQPYVPTQYLYGQANQVITQLELEEKLARPEEARKIQDIVMIQCVGSRGEDLKYCSKFCCGQAVKNALKLLEANPRATIYVLYRDIRTYGFMEDYYQEARERGVVFIPFSRESPPVVKQDRDGIQVAFFNPILGEEMVLTPDLVALSVGLAPAPVEELARLLKVPLTRDGFFLEAHPKLRPVDFSVSGVYLCGAAHGPKPVSEIIAQAQAAAGKASIPLARGYVTVEPIVALVDREACIGCSLCESLCPYAAIRMVRVEKKKKAETLAASCKGCGICASRCPSLAISQGCFTNEQILAQIRAFERKT